MKNQKVEDNELNAMEKQLDILTKEINKSHDGQDSLTTTEEIIEIEKIIKKEEENNEPKLIDDNENTKIFDKVENNLNKTKDQNITQFEVTSNKTKSNKNSYIIIILIILILILSLITIYIIQQKRKPDIKENTIISLTEEEKEKLVLSYGEELELKIKEMNQTELSTINFENLSESVQIKNVKCKEYWINDDKTLYINNCSVNGIKTKYFYGKKNEIVNKESTIDIYESKRGNKVTLLKPEALSLYDVYSIECEDICKNPELLNKNSYIYFYDKLNNIIIYNYKTTQKVFSNIPYQEIFLLKNENNEIDKNLVAVRINNYIGIYNIINENPIIPPMYDDFPEKEEINKTIKIFNNKIIAKEAKKYGVIDYRTNEIIIPFKYESLYKKDNKIIGKTEDGNLDEYDFNCKKINSIPKDTTYTTINNKYKISRIKGNLILTDKDDKEIYNYGKLNVESLNYFKLFEEEDNEKLFIQFFTEKQECINLTYNFKTKEAKITNDECNMH